MRIGSATKSSDDGVLCDACFAAELGISQREASALLILLRNAARLGLQERCVKCQRPLAAHSPRLAHVASA